MLSVGLLALMPPFRPPATPLFTHSPYFSCWSRSDRLTDSWPVHWTGANQGMSGLVLIDGKPFRWMGPPPNVGGLEIPAMNQTSLEVTATRSIYTFQAAGIELRVEFCSPLLADDIDVLARPCSYLTFSEKSIDGQPHRVRAYFDMSGEFVVDHRSDRVDARRYRAGGMDVVSLRSVDNQPLSRVGDRVRCDWGALYLHGPGQSFMASDRNARQAFVEGKVPDDDEKLPRAANHDWPVIGYQCDLRGEPQTIAIAYDEGYAMEFFGRKLRPYWNRKEIGPLQMLRQAVQDLGFIHERCVKLDERVVKEAGALGTEYAQTLSLAYRQCLAGHGMAYDFSVGLLFFPKENSSNGCINTADVVFPASPFFLYFNPKLLLAQIVPLMVYAESDRWPWAFAPHDLGTYPLANGQVYGGGEVTQEDQMPVEETANVLLMLAGIEQKDRDPQLIKAHWPLLVKWAGYLEEKGLDPENQLCTDDFSGHLAHNANLSIKAIIALRAFAELATEVGLTATAGKYRKLSEDWAKRWSDMAKGGLPTVLAFGQAGTWSMKYNLMWDRLLGYKQFPHAVAESEIDAYLAKANQYGPPLDNRATFTKTDWLFWAASLAKDRDQFQRFESMVYKWLNETPDRVAFSDWYDTKSGKNTGFEARTVIGGVAAPLLMRARGRGL